MDALLSGMTGTERKVLIMADHVEARRSSRMGEDLVCNLWFAGARPDGAAIRAVLAKVPSAVVTEGADGDGSLAFDYAGFAFVLHGHAPAAPVAAAMPEHSFAIDAAQLGDAQPVELRISPSQETDAGASLAAVRALAEAALAISSAGECVAIGWRPARSVMGCAYFARIMGEWLDGGPFPALGFVSLTVTQGDGLLSIGLSAVCGQEIEIAPDTQLSNADRARVAVRLIDHLARNGPIEASQAMEIEGFGRFTAELSDLGKKVNLRR